MNSEIERIARQLKQSNSVRRLEFSYDETRSICDVTLAFFQKPANTEADTTIKFCDVQKLELNEFGGGLTQLIGLRVSDVSNQQLDRVNFVVEDVEHGLLKLSCRSIGLM